VGAPGSRPDRLVRAGVTDREAEVLWAVVDRLRNREIAERFHVSVRTVESHIASLLRKLAVADRAALVEAGVELRGIAASETALPVPLTSLVGRDTEMGEITALMDAHRLVTLIGPGGVGKTRLALRVGTVSADRFADGIRLVDLAPVEPGRVNDAIARTLGVVPERGWSLRDVVAEVAAGMRCLLLVDNCEHVVADVADMVANMLTTGGGLRVLATSREPLGVAGEVTFPVTTLSTPDPSTATGAETIAGYDAVRLFVDRASAVSPGFALSDAIAPAVAALCHRLDGLPLAIELAASRVRTFGPVELVEHLDQRFHLLSAGARNAPPRHRTLRGAIDWSYDLLEDDERALLDHLGVFPGDFDFEAVESVCSGAATMTLLPRLVDKSLVSATGTGTRRYRLLETIRSYAAERLSASDGGPAVRQRHAAHYLALAEHAANRLRTADQHTWLTRLIMEQPNLRAGLGHSINTGDVQSAWRWIAALHRFWDVTGQRPEAREWIDRALSVGDPTANPVAVAGLAAAGMVLQSSDSLVAFDLAQRAGRLAAGLDGFSRATALLAVGVTATWVQPDLVKPALREALAGFGDEHTWERALTMQWLASTAGDMSEALRWGHDGVAHFRRIGDQMFAANTLFVMAQRCIYAGVVDDEVHGWLVESQTLARAIGSEQDIVHATVGFGQIAWARGDRDRAAALMEEVLPTLRRLGDRRCAGRALFMLGDRARELGELNRADELLRAAAEAVAVAGQSFVLIWSLEALAAVVSAQGRPRSAAILLGTAQTARASASAHMRPVQPADETLHRALAGHLGDAAFETALREGEAMSPQQALRAVN
jgi:predicted ATPase/DNA-binding CsgD family transcriptional regulator